MKDLIPHLREHTEWFVKLWDPDPIPQILYNNSRMSSLSVDGKQLNVNLARCQELAEDVPKIVVEGLEPKQLIFWSIMATLFHELAHAAQDKNLFCGTELAKSCGCRHSKGICRWLLEVHADEISGFCMAKFLPLDVANHQHPSHPLISFLFNRALNYHSPNHSLEHPPNCFRAQAFTNGILMGAKSIRQLGELKFGSESIWKAINDSSFAATTILSGNKWCQHEATKNLPSCGSCPHTTGGDATS